MKTLIHTTLILVVCFTSLIAEKNTVVHITGQKTPFVSQWHLKETPSNYIISGNTLLDHMHLIVHNNSVIQWKNTRKKDKSTLIAKRKNNQIIITGESNNTPFEKIIPVNQYPWYQTPGFLLKPFILSDKHVHRFFMLRTTTLAPILFEVKKIKKETLSINNTSYKTIKVHLYPASFLRYFWKASLWFDETTGQVIKYDGILNGPSKDSFLITYIEKNK